MIKGKPVTRVEVFMENDLWYAELITSDGDVLLRTSRGYNTQVDLVGNMNMIRMYMADSQAVPLRMREEPKTDTPPPPDTAGASEAV